MPKMTKKELARTVRDLHEKIDFMQGQMEEVLELIKELKPALQELPTDEDDIEDDTDFKPNFEN